MVGKRFLREGFFPGGNGRLGDKTMSIPKSHYFEARPSVPSRPHTVRLKTGEIDLRLQADRGVFGSKGVDLGTLDTAGTKNRKKARSKYGAKREKGKAAA